MFGIVCVPACGEEMRVQACQWLARTPAATETVKRFTVQFDAVEQLLSASYRPKTGQVVNVAAKGYSGVVTVT